MQKRILWIAAVFFGIIFIVALSMALTAKFQQNKIKKVSDTFVSDVLGDDATGSYDLQTNAARQQLTDTEWGQSVDKVSSFFKGKSATFQNATYSAKYAFFTYKISGSDGDYVFKLALTPEGKAWRVQSFKSELQVD